MKRIFEESMLFCFAAYFLSLRERVLFCCTFFVARGVVVVVDLSLNLLKATLEYHGVGKC